MAIFRAILAGIIAGEYDDLYTGCTAAPTESPEGTGWHRLTCITMTLRRQDSITTDQFNILWNAWRERQGLLAADR